MDTAELNNTIIFFEKNYKNLKPVSLLKDFKKNQNSLLNFGYICPGASKTINYLSKNAEKSNEIKILYDKIRRLTDALFFIELIYLYTKYLNENLVKLIKNKILNRHCEIATLITSHITKYFERLPKNIFNNIPDNFYHMRHKTLICSNDKNMVKDRINMLKKIYNNKDLTICNGKRDGVSGCRDCCKKHFNDKEDYNKCVNNCMDY